MSLNAWQNRTPLRSRTNPSSSYPSLPRPPLPPHPINPPLSPPLPPLAHLSLLHPPLPLPSKDIADYIKMEFDEKHGEFGTWHCFVGRKFGCFVTHGKGLFVYFYIGQLGICLFATIQ